jgi:HSP20 family protein
MNSNLARWTPPSDPFRDRMDRWMTQTFGDFLVPYGEEGTRHWMPAVDIRETPDALKLYVELPGLSRDDVTITAENNVLTISGERKFEKDVKDQSFHRVERAYGTFSRSFTLPGNVKYDKVEAKFENGLLVVTLPKLEEAKPRKIEIR